MARRTKTLEIVQIQKTLQEAAVYGAKLIRDNLKGSTIAINRDGKPKVVKLPSVPASKLLAAKIAIEHAIGLPKAKIEVKTDALTMKDIAELAASFDGVNADDNDVLTVPLPPVSNDNAVKDAKN